jgi:hypothetical protein
MAYYFTTPVVNEGPAAENVLHYRYKIKRGVTVVNYDGDYYETRGASQEELEGATKYYLGGMTYEVTAAEKASLEAAGYTVQTV